MALFQDNLSDLVLVPEKSRQFCIVMALGWLLELSCSRLSLYDSSHIDSQRTNIPPTDCMPDALLAATLEMNPGLQESTVCYIAYSTAWFSNTDLRKTTPAFRIIAAKLQNTLIITINVKQVLENLRRNWRQLDVWCLQQLWPPRLLAVI